MRIKRRQVYAIREAIHQVELTIERKDRTQIAEYERDLAATACVALWDLDIPRVLSCLRRLTRAHVDRRESWSNVLAMVENMFRPSELQAAA